MDPAAVLQRGLCCNKLLYDLAGDSQRVNQAYVGMSAPAFKNNTTLL